MNPADDIVTKLDIKDLATILEEKFSVLTKRFDLLITKLDWFTGKYTKFDEEQNLLSGSVSDHSDRLEVIEEKLGITP